MLWLNLYKFSKKKIDLKDLVDWKTSQRGISHKQPPMLIIISYSQITKSIYNVQKYPLKKIKVQEMFIQELVTLFMEEFWNTV